jgi:hypothetical protein
VPVRGLSLQQEIFLARHLRRPGTAVLNAFWNFVHHPEHAATPAAQPEPELEPA